MRDDAARPRPRAGRLARPGATAPLRGAALARARRDRATPTSSATDGVDRGGRRDARPRRRSTATSTSSTGAGCCAIPGLVDCHTHPCVRRRPRRRVLAPRGRRVLRGAARGRRRHPLDGRARRGRPARTGSRAAVARHRGWMLRAGHDDVRGEVGLRARPRHRARVAARDPRRRAGSRPGSARTRCRRVRRRGRLSRLRCSPRCCPTRRGSPRRPTSSSSGARSTPRRRAATSRRAATQGSRCGSTATSSPRRARSRSRSSSAPARSTTSRRRARRRRARSPASDVDRRAAPCERALPRPADAAGTRARRRGRGRRARDRLQPGQRVLREPAARLLARLHPARPRARPRRSPPARSTPPTSSAAPTGSAASRPGYAADLVLLDAPDWRYLAYHLGGDRRRRRWSRTEPSRGQRAA